MDRIHHIDHRVGHAIVQREDFVHTGGGTCRDAPVSDALDGIIAHPYFDLISPVDAFPSRSDFL